MDMPFFIGAALNIDSRQFYTQLYETILQLDACKSFLFIYLEQFLHTCGDPIPKFQNKNLWNIAVSATKCF